MWKTFIGNYDAIKDRLTEIHNFDSEESKINPSKKEEYEKYYQEIKQEYGEKDCVLKINPKIGNKKKDRGARWQCSISQDNFRKYFLDV